MNISFKKIIDCLFILFQTTCKPRISWFLISKSIFLTLINHPQTIFDRSSPKSQSHFLTDYLPHKIIVKAPDGIIFVARPKYEDLARFLFSKVVAKWEPIKEINATEGQIFIDVGANVGYYALHLAKQVGKQGKVIAIEPDPDTFQILKKKL